ncbi:ligand-dependent nuclear receptor-interacting factor 1-like isoform X2 [Ascaphus truei]|uniref:ligand-dependent nuclear receptor-interacting factor 1-like isoform X2 n=1 Tax=Ascaphus truei TaxID=8439 RepID=UPI003F59E3B6
MKKCAGDYSLQQHVSLTGCMYQVVQASGLQGKNVLQLIPVSKSTDKLIPLVQSPFIYNKSTVDVKKQVCFSVPSPLSNGTRPPSVPVPVLQRPTFGNYVIPTNGNSPLRARSISVDCKSPPLMNTTVVLEKSHGKTSSPPQPANPPFMMVSSQTVPVAVKSTPTLPLGHHLQIPANAEVRSILASSLPFAVQQKILAANGSSGKHAVAKNPSVIYVSPVNTVKTVAPKRFSPIYPKPHQSTSKKAPVTLPSTLQSLTENLPSFKESSPNTPMKWIVQENQESASCLVPVKSSNDTASKILKMLTGTKPDETSIANMLPMCSNSLSSNTNIIPIKDNALVMYNNKIYLLAKRGSDVFNTETKPESQRFMSPETSSASSETRILSESINDISNKVVEVVLSKNKVSQPTNNLNMYPNTEAALQFNVNNGIKKERTELPKQFKERMSTNESDIICNIDDPVAENRFVTGKHQKHDTGFSPSKSMSSKLNAATEVKQEDYTLATENKQTKMSLTGDHKPAVNKNKDGSLRLKFGLIKRERVVLRRIPLLRAEPAKPKDVSSLSPKKNLTVNNNVAAEKNKACNTLGNETKVPAEMQHKIKRKSTSIDGEILKRRKHKDGPILKQDIVNTSFSDPLIPSSFPSLMSPSAFIGSPHPPLVKISYHPPVVPSTPPRRESSPSTLWSSTLPPIKITCSLPVLPSTPPATTHSNPMLSNTLPVMPNSTPSVPSPNPESYLSSSNDGSIRISQEPSASFSDVSPANSRLSPESPSPVDLDETVRDEKIRRLKELLREREKALEAIRRQMKS